MNEHGGWIPIDEYCRKYGESSGAIKKRVHDGTWERGVHYANPTGGRAFIHEERAAAWLKSKGRI